MTRKNSTDLEKSYKEALATIQQLKKEMAQQEHVAQLLRESEEKYRTLIEQSNEAIFLLYGGRFEVINPKFEEMFGVTQEDTNAPDFVFTNIVAPKSKGILKQLVNKAAKQKLRPYYEFTALDKHSNEIEVELTVSYPTYQGGLATQGIIRDITDRKRIEKEQQQAYEQARQYSNQLSLKIDNEYQQREIATILAEVVASVSLTLSTDELLKQILLKLRQLVPYDSAAVFLVKDDLLVIEAAQGFDTRLASQKYDKNKLFLEMKAQKSYILIPDTRHDDRYLFWLGADRVNSWIGAPLLIAQEIIGYLAVDRHTSGAFNDDEARLVQAFAHQVAQTIYNAQLFADLNKAQSQLIQGERLTALGQMAATIAHELRNPLMAIRMGVEYFINDLPDDDPRRQGAALMQSNMTRIDRIVEDILYIARSPEPNLLPGSLYEILNNEINRWQLNLTEKRISCHPNLADNLPPVLLDLDQMGRAISNLIGNSVDAMGPDGTIEITLHHNKDYQVITLIDNGPGIPPEHKLQIFEPFFTTKTRGTGLGLSIVKQIVDYHHGDIAVWSEISVGTKFTITLPHIDNENFDPL